METTRFSIPNISCGHCVNAVKKELGELPGVSSVEGDHVFKEITVVWEAPATVEKIKAMLKEINYPASE